MTAAPSRFLVWAHRGASALAPENTLAAFRLAETLGADGIELDVHLTRDRVPVVLHDETLDRTSSGRGPVAQRRWAELRGLDAGRWFASAYAGEPIPTLAEVFAWVGGRLRLNVEIKSAAAGLAVLALGREYPQVRMLVSSFDHRLLEQLRRHDSGVALGFLLERGLWRRALRRAVACRAESLHPRADLVSRPLLAACAEAGLAVFPWTVNRASEWERLRLLGAAGVFTDDPAACVAWRERQRETAPVPLTAGGSVV